MLARCHRLVGRELVGRERCLRGGVVLAGERVELGDDEEEACLLELVSREIGLSAKPLGALEKALAKVGFGDGGGCVALVFELERGELVGPRRCGRDLLRRTWGAARRRERISPSETGIESRPISMSAAASTTTSPIEDSSLISASDES
ncbi:MAG: hypothetical protein U0271_31290 [Polyangiaceae bacterium]